jgi:hypothetical protein
MSAVAAADGLAAAVATDGIDSASARRASDELTCQLNSLSIRCLSYRKLQIFVTCTFYNFVLLFAFYIFVTLLLIKIVSWLWTFSCDERSKNARSFVNDKLLKTRVYLN